MQTYLLLIFLIFILLVLIQVFVTSVYSLVRNDGVPTINTFYTHKKLMKEKLKLKKGSSLIDLGCGTGSALRFFDTNFGCKTLDGVENNKIGLRVGNIINGLSGHKNINLSYGDLYETDISGYDYVYLFLMPKVMPKVETRLEGTLGPDTTVIINTFKLPDRKPKKVIKDAQGTPVLYLYSKK